MLDKTPTPHSHQNLLIGACGWSYKDDWKGVFYPTELKPNQFLEFYSHIFSTVEIDSSFYRIPTKKIVQTWVHRTPSHFTFSGKIPKEVSHDKGLEFAEIEDPLLSYLDNISPLESSNKMLAHLLQLPPKFSIDHIGNLETFFSYWNEWRETRGKFIIGSNYSAQSWCLVVEFRHPSWMVDKTFELLRQYNVAYCAVVEPLLPPRMDITRDDLFYLRFHGYGKNPWFNYLFSQKEIADWAKLIKNSLDANPKTKHVAYFNNHFSGNAVKNALDLMPLVGLSPQNTLEAANKQFQRDIAKKITKTDKNGKSLDKWIFEQKRG
jgi:uncharacterized protein YecE (DUF72 family)